MAIALFIALVALLVFIAVAKTPVTIKSRWQHFYDGINFSTQDFFKKVQEGLAERKVEGLSFDEESFLQSHVFSAKRVYLRIVRNEYVFFICAAPFGTGMFVSWWLCIKDEGPLNKIPLLNKLIGKDRSRKTFYQMDTEAMYRAAIHTTVVETAESLTAGTGNRLSEFQRQMPILN